MPNHVYPRPTKSLSLAAEEAIFVGCGGVDPWIGRSGSIQGSKAIVGWYIRSPLSKLDPKKTMVFQKWLDPSRISATFTKFSFRAGAIGITVRIRMT